MTFNGGHFYIALVRNTFETCRKWTGYSLQMFWKFEHYQLKQKFLE